MNQLIFIRQTSYYFALLFIVLIFPGFQFVQKQNAGIILHDERIPVTPKEFYIANVIDERDNRTAVAWLMPAGNKENKQPKAYPVDFQGGGFVAIKQFIDHNFPGNKTLRPVSINLKKFMATESALADGMVEGHVSIIISFDIKQDNDEALHLADYNGSAIYNRKGGDPQDIEPTLRHVLENGLIYLNTWMNQQASTNIKLATGVKVKFTDYTEKPEGDSIYYSVNRPLTWDDFQSKIAGSRFAAEVMPTIGYEERSSIAKGEVELNFAIKVCLPKSACWVKDGSRNDYTLNHEQRHFDIAKIAAEHFKQKIKTENLPVSNFDGPINVDYLEAYREMDKLQQQYDEETDHGINQSAQQRWNERINKELRELGVKR